MRAGCIAATVVVAVIATMISPPRLRIVWNTTTSTPVGLYAVTHAVPQRGDLLVTWLPADVESLAVARGILSPRTPVLKPVAALAGDIVCRSGHAVTINGRFAAMARELDRHGRRLPIWRYCRALPPDHVFLLGQHPDSFDSRYYGPVHLALARGVAYPLVTFPD